VNHVLDDLGQVGELHLRPGSEVQFGQYFDCLEPDVRDFFENDFIDSPKRKGQYTDVKEQILRRLRSILIKPVLSRMMAANGRR